ncbi:hypothetical protein GCM10022243_39130 [Saccharothrix violaceirubra]|uniref:NAD(P)-dependent dehydrogenase (Short-subunit alcohol dehydrogenase family) n=1 Tax=Saccharothrix violaceirubra TaxID=413306 RepID=A0A7W7T1E9_9PSEU|nr:hypothetical protein [Saccharothrix violaceirubra]MBB4964302.1 NAD(P)-dependent dehydrogenase (short-subunit alcohol dehydrogenase family) [Saccharothrix violaceirubra]
MNTALVLGGTGMLKGCVDDLVDQGWYVVLPCRRPQPGLGQAARTALRRRGHVPHRARSGGQRSVEADWGQPAELAERVADALGGHADLLVAWVHAAYRDEVLRAVGPLLAPRAPVVEVHDSPAISAVRGMPDPVLPDHPTQQVVLGHIRDGGRLRWLTHHETSVGVSEAVLRALAGRAPSVHHVGVVDRYDPA